MLKLRTVSLLLALTTAACDAPTAITTPRMRVSKVSNGIRLENLTDQRRAYFLADQDVIPLLDWAMCANTTPACLRLPAHGTVTVKFADIAAYSASTKSVVVYTWSVVDNGNGSVSTDLDTPAPVVKLD
jgi:hypothetical protein